MSPFGPADLDGLCHLLGRDFWARSSAISMKAPGAPGFCSRFLTPEGRTRDRGHARSLDRADRAMEERQGYAHLALSLGSREAVDAMAAQADGFRTFSCLPRA